MGKYYNTLVKLYNSPQNKSLRILHYPDIQKRAIKDNTDKETYYFKNNNKIDDAESSEVIKSNEERDWKEEAVARAKRTIKEIIRNNYSSKLKMITLTYAEKCDDRNKVLSDIKNMCKRIKEKYQKDLRYIATLEWQKERGCLHVHMVIDYSYIPALIWSKSLWLQGYIKINTISYNKSKSNCLQAVDYVLKYISKDTKTCEYYDHLYLRSKNWNTDIERYYDIFPRADDLFTLASLLLKTSHFSTSLFTWTDWKDDEVKIFDFYT